MKVKNPSPERRPETTMNSAISVVPPTIAPGLSGGSRKTVAPPMSASLSRRRRIRFRVES
jgi:hypothetical protein